MAFDFNEVTGTCTCHHVCDWDIGVNTNTPKAEIQTKLDHLKSLMYLNGKGGFKLFMATLTERQLEDEFDEDNDDWDEGWVPFAKELLETTGWEESARGDLYDAGAHGRETREWDSGYLTIWTVSPPVFYEKSTAYKKSLEDQLASLNKKPVEAEEIARRQQFPELKVINLRKAEMVRDETLLENTIGSKRMVSLETLVMHLKVKYGVDYQKVFDDQFDNKTYREMKQYHADWRAGRK